MGIGGLARERGGAIRDEEGRRGAEDERRRAGDALTPVAFLGRFDTYDDE